MSNYFEPLNIAVRGAFQRLFAALSAVFCFAVAFAVAPNELAAQQYYAQVHGWTVNLVDYGQGPGCTMFRTAGDNTLFLRRQTGQWQIGVRSARAPGSDTIINIDTGRSREMWNAVVVPGGYAVISITPQWVRSIAQAQFVQTAADGDRLRQISVAGVAAAMTKIEECDATPVAQGIPQSANPPAHKKNASSNKSGSSRLYATVKGWEIYTDVPGCTAQNPGEVIVALHTPPGGGWELHIEDLEGRANDMSFPAQIEVDGRTFKDTFFTFNGQYYGSLELDLRKALAAGKQANFIWAEYNLPLDLHGITAAFLKVEECWHKLTGYNPQVSSRAGTYAFK